MRDKHQHHQRPDTSPHISKLSLIILSLLHERNRRHQQDLHAPEASHKAQPGANDK